jgi:hypothetical protein
MSAAETPTLAGSESAKSFSVAACAAGDDRPDRRIALDSGAQYAFFAGLATAIGAGVSMAFSEGLCDTGELTGRGSAYLRGSITGAGTE